MKKKHASLVRNDTEGSANHYIPNLRTTYSITTKNKFCTGLQDSNINERTEVST